MPIEIRELVIKASIDEAHLASRATNGSTQSSSLSSSDKEAIVAACLEQVFKVLEEQKER